MNPPLLPYETCITKPLSKFKTKKKRSYNLKKKRLPGFK